MKYADKALESFKSHQAVVPALWYTEMAQVVSNAAKPLATLDMDLLKAARKLNISLHLG
jgi:hypothetical protein